MQDYNLPEDSIAEFLDKKAQADADRKRLESLEKEVKALRRKVSQMESEAAKKKVTTKRAKLKPQISATA